MDISNRAYIKAIIVALLSYVNMPSDVALGKLIDCSDDYVLENFLISLLKSIVVEGEN